MPEPDFRLRLVDAGRLELHVLPDPAPAPGLCIELARRIAEAAPQLPPPHVVRVETLSGFFDRA